MPITAKACAIKNKQQQVTGYGCTKPSAGDWNGGAGPVFAKRCTLEATTIVDAADCYSCPTGRYQPASGSTACIKCPVRAAYSAPCAQLAALLSRAASRSHTPTPTRAFWITLCRMESTLQRASPSPLAAARTQRASLANTAMRTSMWTSTWTGEWKVAHAEATPTLMACLFLPSARAARPGVGTTSLRGRASCSAGSAKEDGTATVRGTLLVAAPTGALRESTRALQECGSYRSALTSARQGGIRRRLVTVRRPRVSRFVAFNPHSFTMHTTLLTLFPSMPSVANSQCSGYCSSGRYSSATGLTGEDQCKDCERGRFADSVGFPLCKACPSGKAQSATKKTACDVCSRGQYEDFGGASTCKLCHPGSFSQRDGITRSVCVDCMGGRWANISGAESFERCTKLQCPVFSLADRPLMSIQYTNNRELPSHALVSCARGYTPSWDPSIICIWSGIPSAYYSRVAGCCGVLPKEVSLRARAHRTSSPLFPQILTTPCTENITYWVGLDKNNELPRCIGVQCPIVVPPEHGRVNYTNERRYPNGQTGFMCPKGFEIHSPAGIAVAEYFITCQANRTWDLPAPKCVRRKCPQLAPLLGVPVNTSEAVANVSLSANQTRFAGVVVTVPTKEVPLQWNFAMQTADWRYGDRAIFGCTTLNIYPTPHTQSMCTADGVWDPAPGDVACRAMPCQSLESPPGQSKVPSAMILWVSTLPERHGLASYVNWEEFDAPKEMHFECARHANLYINDNFSQALCRPCASKPFNPSADGEWQRTIGERDVCCSLRVQCTHKYRTGTNWFPEVNYPSFAEVGREGLIAERSVPGDTYYRRLECRCQQGFINVEDDRRAECQACEDGTYAPLLRGIRRVECRACPREGVSCQGGVLEIIDDWWYDVNK